MRKNRKQFLSAIAFIVILLVFQCSPLKSVLGISQADGEGVGQSDRLSTRSDQIEKRTTRSHRVKLEDDPLDAHQVNLDAGESLVLVDRLLADGKPILLQLTPIRVVREDGSEEIVIAPTLFDAPENILSAKGFEDLVSGSETEKVMDEVTRLERFQVLFTTKGTDMMRWHEQTVGEGEVVQVLCCPGIEQALVIDVGVRKDRNGMTKIHFGEPYLRPVQEGDRPGK